VKSYPWIFLYPAVPQTQIQFFYVLSELAQGRIPDLKNEKLQWN
jgi:hypothetical protein